MSNKLLVAGLICLMTLITGCGSTGTPTRPNDFVPLTSIQIQAVSATIAAKTSTRLVAIGNFSGQFTRDITDQVSWSSDTPTVAGFVTATQSSRVTGNLAGSANLTATVGTLTSTFNLKVSAATISTLTITPATPSVPKGLSTQFTVSGTFSDASVQDLTFDAVWSSTPGTFASVSNDPASKGFARALAEGTETVSATFDGMADVAQLTVTPKALQSITVSPAGATIAGLAQTLSFTANGSYSDGTSADITTLVAWASSNTTVATIVATTGVATSVEAGTSTISAVLDGITGTQVLTVKILDLRISPASPVLTVAGTTRLTLTSTPPGGSASDVTAASEWTSSNPAVATVGNVSPNKGLVTAVAAGSCIITAAHGGQIMTTTVIVQ